MGSGSSRGKKIAPEGGKEGKPEMQTFKIGQLTDFSPTRIRARPDCHSQGQDSGSSDADEEDDIDRELDRVLAGYETFHCSGNAPPNPLVRANTYSLCHPRQVYPGSGFSSTPHLQSADLRGKCAARGYEPRQEPLPQSSSPDLASCKPTVVVHVSSEDFSPSPAVIQYNGSEEELMATIEREFS